MNAAVSPLAPDVQEEEAPVQVLFVPWAKRLNIPDGSWFHLVYVNGQQFDPKALCGVAPAHRWLVSQRLVPYCDGCLQEAIRQYRANPAIARAANGDGAHVSRWEPDVSTTCPGCGCKSDVFKTQNACPICHSTKGRPYP